MTKNDIRLSIIIATWNAASTLERCLASIFAQTFDRFEVLVADAMSEDGTREIIARADDRIDYWHSRHDAGIYDAWNQALVHARGEYVCFLGADDALHAPDTLARIFDAIGDEEYDLVSSRANLRDADFRVKSSVGAGFDYAELPRRMFLVHPGLLHRRELFDRHGLFDPGFRIAGDLDFLLRLPASTRTFHHDTVTVDIQDDGISRRQFWERIRERRRAHARCARVGRVRALAYWLDKAWRRPIALIFRLPH